VSDAARRARKLNLSKARLRSERESRVIKLLIWQSYLDDSNSFSQRALARQLGVYPSYLCKVQKQPSGALDAFASGARATLDDYGSPSSWTTRLAVPKSARIQIARRLTLLRAAKGKSSAPTSALF